jgi:hypothetical protein
MVEVADIIGLHGAAYQQRFGNTLSPVQKRALRDISACRTPFFGGHVYQCDHCRGKVFSYHSCRNRSCPKCHQDQTQRWIGKQRLRLLPCPYFLVTFTLPSELRSLARAHPKKIYGLLMKAAADALQKLAADPRYIGARIGALAVLHTWTRAMLFHPHVHMLVTAGGLSADNSEWIDSKHPHFLVPVRALSVIFRAKFRAGLKKSGLLDDVPPAVWKKNWVVHSQHAGRGEKVLDYLGRYVFRIAITNNRLESIDNGMVRFRYRDNRTQQTRHVTLPGVEFISRFLQHVLPRGAVKVRYYGIWSPSCRKQLDRARTMLLQNRPPAHSPIPSLPQISPDSAPAPICCPLCRVGVLILVDTRPAQRSHSP